MRVFLGRRGQKRGDWYLKYLRECIIILVRTKGSVMEYVTGLFFYAQARAEEICR